MIIDSILFLLKWKLTKKNYQSNNESTEFDYSFNRYDSQKRSMPNSTSKISGAFKNSWTVTKKGKEKVFVNYNLEFELR